MTERQTEIKRMPKFKLRPYCLSEDGAKFKRSMKENLGLDYERYIRPRVRALFPVFGIFITAHLGSRMVWGVLI